jgi:peroxiredoxin/predicted nucleic acid-binding Zn ribbon protein
VGQEWRELIAGQSQTPVILFIPDTILDTEVPMKKCPVCGVSVKVENLEKHVKRQHPKEKVELSSVVAEKELRDAKEEKRPTRRRVNRKAVGLVSLVAAIIIVVVLVIAFSKTGEVQPTVGNNVGQIAPDFMLQTTDADYVSLSSYRGEPVLLAFVDIDGAPCQAECDILASVHIDYASSVHFFSIDVDMIQPSDSPQKVNDFKTAKNTPWPYALDPDRTVVNSYGISTRPCVFIVDDGGIIRSRFVGRAPNGYASYASALDTALHR